MARALNGAFLTPFPGLGGRYRARQGVSKTFPHGDFKNRGGTPGKQRWVGSHWLGSLNISEQNFRGKETLYPLGPLGPFFPRNSLRPQDIAWDDSPFPESLGDNNTVRWHAALSLRNGPRVAREPTLVVTKAPRRKRGGQPPLVETRRSLTARNNGRGRTHIFAYRASL